MQTETSLWDLLIDLWALELRPTNDARGGGYFVRMPTRDQVSEPDEVTRLANVLVGLRLARRALPDWIADQVYFFEGKLRCPETGRYLISEDFDVEQALSGDESHRWFSDFLKFAQTPPSQRAQARVVERLKLIHIAVSIHQEDMTPLDSKAPDSPTMRN